MAAPGVQSLKVRIAASIRGTHNMMYPGAVRIGSAYISAGLDANLLRVLVVCRHWRRCCRKGQYHSVQTQRSLAGVSSHSFLHDLSEKIQKTESCGDMH